MSPQLNVRSGISLTFEGTNGRDFIEEYLYYDTRYTDLKTVSIRSATPFHFSHNERNVLAVSPGYLTSSDCAGSPYCRSNGWNGPDNIPDSDDENWIGANGYDGIPNSGDEGRVLFRVNRAEQFHSYSEIPSSTDAFPTNYEGTSGRSFNFGEFNYAPGIPVLGSIGSNGGAYGEEPSKTTERYNRAIVSPEGDLIYTLTYWDQDRSVLPTPVGRGKSSDGAFVPVVVDPLTPILRLSAPTGEQFYTTPVVTWNDPIARTQTSFVTRGVIFEVLSLVPARRIFVRLDGGAAIEYRGPFNLSQVAQGTHRLEVWFENGPVKERTIVVDPEEPSASERHGYLMWGSELEREAIVARLNAAPFDSFWSSGTRSFLAKLHRESQEKLTQFPLTRRGYHRQLMYLSDIPFEYALPLQLDPTLPAEDLNLYGTIVANALKSILAPEFVGADNFDDDWRPCTDIYGIPNSGHNIYSKLALAYDLLASLVSSRPSLRVISPIDNLYIRDLLGKTAYTMLKYRENKGFTTRGADPGGLNPASLGSGDIHWGHGEELLAYLFGAAMPKYDSLLYGRSGFDGTRGGRAWAPYPEGRYSWYELLTDPAIPYGTWPNPRAPARHFEIYKSNARVLSFARSPSALWPFPASGFFWHGANSVGVASTVLPLGSPVVCVDGKLSEGTAIILPPNDTATYPCGQKIWTIDGLKLVSSWNDLRQASLTDGDGSDGGAFLMENGGYETPFQENTALVQMIHRRNYGRSISPNVEGYFLTKFDRMLGRFEPQFLLARGDSKRVTDGRSNRIPLNNQELLAVNMPIGAFSPLVADNAVEANQVLLWGDLGRYPGFWSKSFEGDPLQTVLFAAASVAADR